MRLSNQWIATSPVGGFLISTELVSLQGRLHQVGGHPLNDSPKKSKCALLAGKHRLHDDRT